MAKKYIRIGSLEDIHIYDDNDFTDGIDSEGPIKASMFKTGTEEGVSTSITIVTDVRMNGAQLQKKTLSITITSGILTTIGTTTDWTNTTDI